MDAYVEATALRSTGMHAGLACLICGVDGSGAPCRAGAPSAEPGDGRASGAAGAALILIYLGLFGSTLH